MRFLPTATLASLRALCAALAGGLVLLLTACQSQRQTNTLVVGTDASFPPMEYVDDSGAIVGFDIDLIQAVAREAGLNVEIRNVAWDGIFGALKAGNIDIIVSSVTITDDRQAQFDFTRPYLKAGQVIIVRAGDKEKFPDAASLKGKKVGVQIGTTGAEFMEKLGGTELKQYNTAGLAMIDLSNGNVDAVVIDKPVADYYARKAPGTTQKLEVASEPQTDEQFGFVVRKGEKELLQKLDDALARIEQNGTLRAVESRWFR